MKIIAYSLAGDKAKVWVFLNVEISIKGGFRVYPSIEQKDKHMVIMPFLHTEVGPGRTLVSITLVNRPSACKRQSTAKT